MSSVGGVGRFHRSALPLGGAVKPSKLEEKPSISIKDTFQRGEYKEDVSLKLKHLARQLRVKGQSGSGSSGAVVGRSTLGVPVGLGSSGAASGGSLRMPTLGSSGAASRGSSGLQVSSGTSGASARRLP